MWPFMAVLLCLMAKYRFELLVLSFLAVIDPNSFGFVVLDFCHHSFKGGSKTRRLCIHSAFLQRCRIKPLSVTNNNVDSRTAAAGNVGAAIVAHVARSGRSRIDAVIR